MAFRWNMDQWLKFGYYDSLKYQACHILRKVRVFVNKTILTPNENKILVLKSHKCTLEKIIQYVTLAIYRTGLGKSLLAKWGEILDYVLGELFYE